MAAASEASIIRVRDLVVGFGSQTVLNGVSLDVRRGEILGIVGASGGGKSVLLRTIIGLLRKRRGRITVFDTDIGSATPEEMRSLERRWGVLFQQGALFSSLTAQENVQFPMREHLNVSKALYEEVASAKLEMVGIGPDDARNCLQSSRAAWSSVWR
jgi:phospholipid/cholesterol/gamma-HCH transport system ATP-binding protein